MTSVSEWVERHLQFLFHIGTFVALGAVAAVPAATIVYFSFHSWQLGISSVKWIGFGNFVELVTDERFINAIGHTLYFVAGGVSIQLLLGLGIALLLNREVKGKMFYRIVILLPMMCMPSAISMIWRIMYNRTFGILTHLATAFGLAPIGWLGTKNLAIPALLIVDVWQWTPFIMIILLAGLQSLPQSCFEAAVIDGASRTQTFLYVTLPLMKFHILAAVVLRSILSFKVFDKVWIITEAGPGFASETLNVYTYSQAFLYFRFGYASAVGIAFSAIILGMTVFQIRMLRGAR